MPTLYIIAGPNGVGKTTFADSYLPDEARQVEFVNADLIARGLSPYDPDSVTVDAGRIALKRIRELIAQRKGFTWETTMSGRSAAYFLWVPDPEILIRRIRQRVAEGGHDIAEALSKRRFLKTIQNFFGIYRHLVDDWKLYENDLPAPRLLAVQKGSRLAFRDRQRISRILTEAGVAL